MRIKSPPPWQTVTVLGLLTLAGVLLAGLLLLLIATLLQMMAPYSGVGPIVRLGALVLLLAPPLIVVLSLIFCSAAGVIHLIGMFGRERDRRAEREQLPATGLWDAPGRAPVRRAAMAHGYDLADPDRTAGCTFHSACEGERELLAPKRRAEQTQRTTELVTIDGGWDVRESQWGLRAALQPGHGHAARAIDARPGAVPLAAQAASLPALVDLGDWLTRWTPTSMGLLLGVATTGPIYAELQQLMHTGVGGATGWGKSMASLQLATQLGLCPDVLLAVADPDAVSYQPLAAGKRLCLPMPETAEASKQVLVAVQDEIAARYRLIGEGWRNSGIPMQSADEYNRWAGQHGAEPILPLVLLVDEWPELVHLGAAALASSIVKRGRKASVYAVLASQGWSRADAGEIGIRRQFHTVFQLGVKEAADARPLVGTEAAQRLWERIDAGLFRPGDALLQRAGPQPDVFVRVPYIEPQKAVRLLAAMPAVDPRGLVSQRCRISSEEKGVETVPENVIENEAGPVQRSVEFRNGETCFSALQTVSSFHEHTSIEPERLARIAALRARGQGKTAIVRMVWGVTSGPRYQAAARDYERYATLIEQKVGDRHRLP